MSNLENNLALVAALRDRAQVAALHQQLALAALLAMAADALEHTHEIATTGWLET